MFNLISQIETFLRGMWRFNWWAVGLSWVLFLAGTTLVLMMPNQYQAKASFYVKDYSVLEPILEGVTVQSDVAGHAYVLAEAIKSRTIMEKLILESTISERLEKDEDLSLLVTDLQKKIMITTERESLYDLEFIDSDPQVAYEIVDILLNQFLNEVLTGKVTDARIAELFLDEQIKEYEQRLNIAERELADFKKENIEVMPATNVDYVQSLHEAKAELELAQVELRKALGKRDILLQQIRGETPLVGVTGFTTPTATSTSPASAQMEAVRRQLNEDLLKYTENHPKVLASKAMLKTLGEQMLNERKKGPAENSGLISSRQTNANVNPIYQSAKIALRRSEAEVASAQATVNEYRRKVAKLRNSLDGVSEVEAELSKLTRDYEIIKTQYLELSKRLEIARLSQEAEKGDDSVKFQIIDPPIVPISSLGPNRPLLITAVLILSIVIGSAFALFLDQAKPVFLTTHNLSRETSLPVYGAVSMKVSDHQVRAERTTLAAFVMLIVLLVGFYSVTVIKHEEGATMLSSYLTK